MKQRINLVLGDKRMYDTSESNYADATTVYTGQDFDLSGYITSIDADFDQKAISFLFENETHVYHCITFAEYQTYLDILGILPHINPKVELRMVKGFYMQGAVVLYPDKVDVNDRKAFNIRVRHFEKNFGITNKTELYDVN